MRSFSPEEGLASFWAEGRWEETTETSVLWEKPRMRTQEPNLVMYSLLACGQSTQRTPTSFPYLWSGTTNRPFLSPRCCQDQSEEYLRLYNHTRFNNHEWGSLPKTLCFRFGNTWSYWSMCFSPCPDSVSRRNTYLKVAVSYYHLTKLSLNWKGWESHLKIGTFGCHRAAASKALITSSPLLPAPS